MNRYRDQPKRVRRASDPPKAPRGHRGVSAFAIVLLLLWAGSVSALKSDPVQVSARGNILQAHLDFHAGTGNLFAVLLNYESGYWNWLVNISTDNGATWTETYEWQSTMAIADISAVVAGDYLYVANSFDGLMIIDISEPANPTEIGHYDTNNAKDIAIGGDYAYIADTNSGLAINDISDPRNPSKEGHY